MLPDERTYWAEQMEAGYAFMQRMLDWPVAECREPLRCIRAAAEAAGVEVAYEPGKKIGLFDRIFHVRASLVDRLLAAAEAMLRRGWVLKIEDAYRTPATQRQGACSEFVVRTVLDNVRWELGGADPTPELLFRRLAAWTATVPKFANHTSGSAVDVSVLNRRDGRAVNLGGRYPELSLRTPMDSPFAGVEALRNRRVLCDVFAEQGFLPYPYEFWHFSHGDADHEMQAGQGRPARFGPVEGTGADGQVQPLPDLLTPLITLDDIREPLARLLGQ